MEIHIHIHHHGEDRVLTEIKNLKTIVMTNFADIKAAHEAFKEALTAEIQQIADKLAELSEANGTEEERAALLADIQAQTERVKGIIADEPTPTPEP